MTFVEKFVIIESHSGWFRNVAISSVVKQSIGSLFVLETIESKHKREVHEKNVVCHICNKD